MGTTPRSWSGRRQRWLLFLVLFYAAGATAQPRESRPLQGRPLAEALRDLQRDGLPLVFTDQLVDSSMRVVAEPTGETPRGVLEELLAPWGLSIRVTSDGTLVVVPGEEGRREEGRLVGSVRATLSGRGIPGARVLARRRSSDSKADAASVELELVCGADGRYERPGIPAGTYTVQATAPGFLPGAVQSVRVEERERGVEVSLQLLEVPLVQEELVIRPARLQLTWEEPAAAIAVGRREIEALPHLGNDIFRAMSLAPGVSANDITAHFWVHGGRPDEVKIELDGQELYEAFHLKDYDDALSVVSADTLAGLTLSTGGYAASEGDRMSGVLDMRTRLPESSLQGAISASLLAFAASGSGLLQRGRGDWLAQARIGSIDLASRLFRQEDPSYADLFGRLSIRPGARHALRGNALLTSDGLRFDETTDEGFKVRDTEYENAYLWLTHQGTIGDNTLVETRLAWSEIARDRLGSELEEEGEFRVSDHRRTTVPELEQSWSLYGLPAMTLRLGVEGRLYETSFDYAHAADRSAGLPVFVPPDFPAEPTARVTRFLGRFENDHFAGWVSGRTRLQGPLSAEIGIRYDHHSLTEDSLLSPRVNLAWSLSKGSVLRGSWGHFYQSQRSYELEVQDAEHTFSRAERSTHWLLGYEWLRLESASIRSLEGLRVELYHRDISSPRPRYENLFEAFNLFPEVEPDRVRLVPETGYASGVELSLNGRLGQRALWRFSYAWATVEDRIDRAWYRRRVDQPHSLSAIVGLPIGEHWRVDLAWRFHTGWPITPVELGFWTDEEGPGEPVLLLGPYNAKRLGPYHRLDLRASRSWRVGRGRLSFFADVQNLYNRRNQAGYDYSSDEETGELIGEAEEWPGLFPSLGVKWDF